ncbi:hypothetical protein [Salmonella phage SD-1_S14]|nr:hypothetical protein [Salmonella phage SD-1_S14]
MRQRLNHKMYCKLLQTLAQKHYDTVSEILPYDIMRLIHSEAEMLVLMTGTDKKAIAKSIDMFIEAHCQHMRTEIWRKENDNP